jgi:CBS domain-containing protein
MAATGVREVMSRDLVAIAPSATVAEAATVMGERGVGSALVVEGDALVGIFTERDIVRALAADFDAPRLPVDGWMTRDPVTTQASATTREALERMLAGGFRHLPVLDGDRLVGMVSMRDLSRAASTGPATRPET